MTSTINGPHHITPDAPMHYRVAIVGSGFAGLGMAIRLKRDGIEDFVVLERADDVGGTWRDNTYPGCQCDVPSHLYSFSFAPNPSWSRTYSRQPEIQAYLRRVARDFGVYEHVRFGHELRDAAWDEDARVWRLTTAGGELTADVTVLGVGALSEPRMPDIPGMETFQGTTFHSATWNHDHDLENERVAVIGTGASAIQFVPEIQPTVAKLHVFQRTPPWIMPHTDRPVTAAERRVFRRFPAVQRLIRNAVWAGREWLVIGLTRKPRFMRLPAAVGRRHLRGQVSDAELRARLTPDYTVGCKRILLSDKWYPALQRDNVEVVTDAVTEIRPHSVVTADGTEREVDTIIAGTGFLVTDFPAAQRLRGRGGQTLAEAWNGSMRAYLGTTVAGFPNLFTLVGPNTGLGHSSMVYMIESQVAYVADALRVMAERGVAEVDVREDVQAAYNDELQRRMGRTVWSSGGCASWYLDANGRNTTLWPDFTFAFRNRTRRFEAGDYDLRPRRETPAGAPASVAS
ncbi:MAG TPA: NAD(P)/FAD-dependent oxidoreductase [Solirubrobacteraceae bacterium]